MGKYCFTGNFDYWHTIPNSKNARKVAMVKFQCEICPTESEGSTLLAVV